MTRLPVLMPKDVIAALKRAGFVEAHQTGSHIFMRQEETGRTTTIAIHARDLPRSHLKTILKQAGLSEEQFRKLI